MVHRNRRGGKKAPCGCPAGDPRTMGTSTRCPQQYGAACPGIVGGRARQHGTDLQIPLNQPHIEYYDALHYQTLQVPLSWQSGSTQIENITSEEEYSRYNQDGLGATFGLPLTPEFGTNLNEPYQMVQAEMYGRARAISELMGRFVEGEPQEDIEVQDGYPVYASPRSMPMGPCHSQPPTKPYGTMAAQYGNPSSRGQSPNHHSGRRSSHDQSSSSRGHVDVFAAAGDQFEGQEYEIASELSVSGYVEDGVFHYEH